MIFVDLTLPFAAVTTDGATARPHVVRDGPRLPGLQASAAIPGILPSVDLDDRQLYDGGLAANVPMHQAVEIGARSLVGRSEGVGGGGVGADHNLWCVGGCRDPGMRAAPLRQHHRPVRSATSLNNPTVACDTTPRTSADTATPMAALRYASPGKCLPARIIGTAKGLFMPCRTGTAAYLHPASPAIARRIQVRRLGESNYQSS